MSRLSAGPSSALHEPDIEDDEDDDEDEHVEQFTSRQWDEVARQIRSLTNALWVSGAHQTLVDNVVNPRNAQHLDFYRAWATLLTRDSNGEAVVAVTGTGPRRSDATEVLAVMPYYEDPTQMDTQQRHSPVPIDADYEMLDPIPTKLMVQSRSFDTPPEYVFALVESMCGLTEG